MLFFAFVITGCSPDAEEIIRDIARGFDINLDEDGEIQCYPGNASLPPGTYPKALVTPQGYHMNCGRIGNIHLHSDGTITGTVPSSEYEDRLAYWQECRHGTQPPEQKGRWIAYDEGGTEEALCVWTDIQPGIISCLEGSYAIDDSLEKISVITVYDYSFYDGNGNFLGNIEESEYGQFSCRLRKG
jgi:hypothetical protein